ncbi:ABC transporter [Sorangium cellulosum]|uniref:ABC transporter n=1 Tax=Sorangium cellulosum TaxID=56 RepID=A0A4P2QD45_SORCE|nr:ATP-binding cassette domain-containing protein [Sorangium cellulosum]AUX27266.1 ABC transporter [Sorangium cellulosum]
MLSLRAQRLSFSYSDASTILADVDLCLVPGWYGIVGPNGAGKTTLLRLFAGDLAPEAGSLRLDPRGAAVAVCPQAVERAGAAIHALAEAEDGAARRLRGALLLDPAELGRWDTLSPGERKRWQIGAALAGEPDVLLLDEPTNHIDADARALLVGALGRFPGIGVCVSHDRELLDALTVGTIRVDRGEARLYPGGYGAARELWEAEARGREEAHQRLRAEERQLRRRLGEERRAQAAADADRSKGKRIKGPRDHDARSMAADFRVSTAEARLSRNVGVTRRKLEKVSAEAGTFELEKAVGRSVFVGYERSPTPWLLVLDAPEIRAGGGDGRVLLRDVRLGLGREDRVRIAGPNGGGKTTLVKALLSSARVPADKVLVVPQELGEAEEQALLATARRLRPEERGRVMSLVAALGVEPGRLLASARPSPGEARKLMIAMGLGRHVWALVLDEPTNHLDLPSIERLERALADYPGALLLVTHDQAFGRSCTSILWTVADGEVRVSSDSAGA